jgi:hypothetical protein
VSPSSAIIDKCCVEVRSAQLVLASANVALPFLTPAQRADAAARATAARRTRAALRADLKSGRLRVSDVIIRAESDEAVAKLRVVALLEALPGVGKTKAAAIMDKNAIALSRRVRGLGPHQRDALTRQFG